MKRKLVNKNKLFNDEKEGINNKITSMLNKIKSIEEQNFKKYHPSFNQRKNPKSIKSEFKEITFNEKKEVINNHITINNNYYTIINNMTINNINDNNINKLKNNNFSLLKIDDYWPNYNHITYFKSQTSKNKSKNLNFNDNIKSRNQSNSVAKRYNKNSNILFNDNNIKLNLNLSFNKNRLNKSFVNKRKINKNKNDTINKKSNVKSIQDKNISLKEKIHLFHLKRQALVKKCFNDNLGRKVKNKK